MTNEYLPRAKWARILVAAAYAAVAAGLLWAAGKLLPASAPFIVAWIPAWALARPVDWIKKRTRLPRGLIAVTLCAALIAAVTLIVFFAGGKLVSRAGDLVGLLDRAAADIKEKVGNAGDALRQRFPALERAGGGELIENSVNRIVGEAAGKASAFVAGTAAALVSGAPSAMLFVVVTVVASFYFVCGYPSIVRFFSARLPRAARESVSGWIASARRTVRAYVRCAVIMSAVSFGVLTVGFMIMGIKDPALAALICAAVDVLPVFGVGTVLVPWAIIKIVGGEYGIGFGLAILYGICTLVRQILEPRLMSDSFGLHPAASLAAMYLGFRFFGFPGMLLMPVAAAAAVDRRAADGGKATTSR